MFTQRGRKCDNKFGFEPSNAYFSDNFFFIHLAIS